LVNKINFSPKGVALVTEYKQDLFGLYEKGRNAGF
jgi:hypothetical protein